MSWNITTQPTPTQQQPTQIHVCCLFPHHGYVSLEWVNTTYAPLVFIQQPDFAKSYRISRGIYNLDTHRNLLAKNALEDKTVTHLFWVDTDNIIESPTDINQALRILLSLNVPIVSALYRAKKSKGQYPYCMWAGPVQEAGTGTIGYVDIPSWSGNWISVGAVGFGAILIKREVFERTPYPWFEWHEPPNPSEDFFACDKFRKQGYEIKVFTEVRFSHEMNGKVICTDGQVHMLDV